MCNIPYYFICRSIIYVMQSKCQFHYTKTRSKMTTNFRYSINCFPSQLIRKLF